MSKILILEVLLAASGLTMELVSVLTSGFVGWFLLISGGFLLLGSLLMIFDKYREILSLYAFCCALGVYIFGIIARSNVTEVYPIVGYIILALMVIALGWLILYVGKLKRNLKA